MGLGGRLCTASEKKKNVAIILKAVITESERAAASGLGGAATLFAKEVKKKMKCFLLENNRHKHLVGFITKPILRR